MFVLRSTHLLFSTATLLISLSGCQRHKLAYVNPVKLSQEYEGVKAKLAQFQTTVAPWQANVDTLNAELQRAGARYERERESLTAAQRTTREQELGHKQQQLAQYREAVIQKATAERQRLDKEVLDEINPYLKEFGKREGDTFIFGATASGNLVYAAESVDVTEAILQRLNERYRRLHPSGKCR